MFLLVDQCCGSHAALAILANTQFHGLGQIWEWGVTVGDHVCA